MSVETTRLVSRKFTLHRLSPGASRPMKIDQDAVIEATLHSNIAHHGFGIGQTVADTLNIDEHRVRADPDAPIGD